MKRQQKKHTPIVSKKQRAMFGAELSRRESGKLPRIKGISTKQLKEHLSESRGKKLPLYVRKKIVKKKNKKEWFDWGIYE